MKIRRVAGGVAIVATALAAISACSAWRALSPGSDFDFEPPVLPAELARPALLVFSKTAGYRHEEAIPAGIAALREIAAARGWGFFATERGAVHTPELLARFDAVVWHNASGDVLDDAQRASLRDWLEAGGGWVGIHGSGGDPSYRWRWYVEELLGAQFVGHPMGPQFQEARLAVEDREHPATRHLPESWVRTDEWYSFEASPRERGVRVLVSIDESSYQPELDLGLYRRDLRMGEDHPVVWTRCIERGRAFYSALGHRADAYAEPEHLGMLEGAVAWAMGLQGGECGAP